MNQLVFPLLIIGMKSAYRAYQLHIELRRSAQIAVGSLGVLSFPEGRYVYTGSARRNLEARIRRHLKRKKTLRWHIDYLLAHPAAHLVRVVRSSTDECVLNQATVGEIPFPRFGASDCRSRCLSHLKQVGPQGAPGQWGDLWDK